MNRRPSPAIAFVLVPLVILAACASSPPAAAALPGLDVARLQPRQDRFEIQIGGKARGTQTCSLTADGDGFCYREETSMPPMVQQTTTVWLDRTGRVTKVEQRGTMMGKAMQIDAAYGNGRVDATAITPTAPEPVVSHLELPPSTTDDNAIAALLPALAFAPGAKWEWNVFSTGKGKHVATQFECLAPTLPDGRPGYLVRVRGGDSQQDWLLSATTPPRILTMQAVGTPMLMRRVE